MSWMIQLFLDRDIVNTWSASATNAKRALSVAARHEPRLIPFLGCPMKKRRTCGDKRGYCYRIDFNQWTIYLF